MAAKTKKQALKTDSCLGTQWVEVSAESRWNPLRFLEPEILTQYIEAYECGNFSWLDRTMRAMERRDDTWKITAAKARKDVSRRKWQVSPLDGFEDDEEAAKQADTLQAFYSSLRARDYDCINVYSGMRGLVAGAMHAFNSGFSIAEIVWKPTPQGLTAEVTRCPLEWFRLINGQMCLVAGGVQTPLEEGGWIITRGDGVGVACSVAYMLKKMALGDWAVYSGRCGHPGIQGKTNAAKGTQQWSDFVSALRKFGKEWACVTGLNDEIEKIDLSVQGTLPYPLLVERMDRAIAALQRGADLSTISSGNGSGKGASLQGDESDLIAADNCESITESFRGHIDPHVLRWQFGDDVEVKAGFQLVPPQRDTIDRDLKIDDVLSRMNVKLSKRDALNRYNRREVADNDPDDAPLTAPEGLPAPNPKLSLANEKGAGKRKRRRGIANGADAGDPLAEVLRRAAAKILDGSVPLQEAIDAAQKELAALPSFAGAFDPAVFQKQLETALFDAAAQEAKKETKP